MSPSRAYHLEPPHKLGSSIPRSPSCSSSESSIFSRPSSPESDSNDDDTMPDFVELLPTVKSAKASLALDISPETLHNAMGDLRLKASSLHRGHHHTRCSPDVTRAPLPPLLADPTTTDSPGPRSEALENYLSGLPRLGSRESEVYLLDRSTLIKMGDDMLLHEASILRFVAENTSIPVPRVLGFGRVPGTCDQAYMFMDHIAGEPLSEVWDGLDGSERAGVVDQLHQVYGELRRHTHNSVCSVLARSEEGDGVVATAATVYDQAGCTDNFFGYPVGPFNSEPDFVNELAHAMVCRGGPASRNVLPMLEDLAVQRRPQHPKSTFLTHGQLNPRNVLIRDGRVVGILDWSEAGFYPEWWEYVKAHFDGHDSFVDSGAVSHILDHDFPVELETMLHARDVMW